MRWALHSPCSQHTAKVYTALSETVNNQNLGHLYRPSELLTPAKFTCLFSINYVYLDEVLTLLSGQGLPYISEAISY